MTAYVHFVGWTIWLIMLPAFLLFGSGLLHSPAFGSLANDELTATNRRAALLAVFRAMLLTAAIRYGISASMKLDVRPAIQVMATGVGVALMHFGSLEQRALKA